MRRSTGASGTSWGRCTRGRQRHRRYHLVLLASGSPNSTVRHLDIHSRSVRYGGSLGRRTDGSRLDHVADGESLDRLVLGGASRAVGATDGLDVAATLLVTAVGRSLLDHVGLILSGDVSGCLAERERKGRTEDVESKSQQWGVVVRVVPDVGFVKSGPRMFEIRVARCGSNLISWR